MFLVIDVVTNWPDAAVRIAGIIAPIFLLIFMFGGFGSSD